MSDLSALISQLNANTYAIKTILDTAPDSTISLLKSRADSLSNDPDQKDEAVWIERMLGKRGLDRSA